MKRLFIIIFLLLNFKAYGLEVDEKLTLKILDTSSTKKTLLVNRGLEDGLVKGDHAKFFNETGVFARAVLVKVSPSRSVWSVYQLIKPDEITKSLVANLKVSTPVKVTADKTKMLTVENTPESSLVPLAPEAYDDPNNQLTGQEQKDLAALEDANIVEPMEGVFSDRDLEWYSLIQFDSTSSSSDLASNGTATGSNSIFNLTFGLEKYFSTQENWLKNTSIQIFGVYSAKETSALEGSQSSLTNVEGGIGFNYHFMAPANSFGRLISFANFSFGFGTSQDAFTVKTISDTTNTILYEGSSNFFSFGYGLKYFTFGGFGFKALAEYMRRGETYNLETEDVPFSKQVSGPRLQVGISYRW
ncbi:MAG: hypothetical protein CME61_06555 [Halobacteriovoraceae bacterium]|nr:hypothetical protein [Halobacteriovoraceae bacterium]|tara:strand:+ start:153 stop:1226 length:1074 start_codon:yes stop_codon:yes gene_type:complete